MGRPRVAAHRGGAGLWPENSLCAVRGAIALGVALVEMDVHLARDGGVVVTHDRTLERTTEGRGAVGDCTTDELRALRLRARDGSLTDERIPRLEDVLSVVASSEVGLLIELKGPGPALADGGGSARRRPAGGPRYEGLEAAVLARLDSAGLRARTTVMAFNPDVVAAVHALAPALRTCLLIDRKRVGMADASLEEVFALATALGATDVGIEHTLVDAAVVVEGQRRALGVGVWTVDDAAAIGRYAAMGVDVLTTDRPDVALAVLGAPATTPARSPR